MFDAGDNFTHPWFNDLSLVFTLVAIMIFIIFQLNRKKSRIKYGFSVLPLKFEILKLAFLSLGIIIFFSIMIFYLGIPYAVLLVMFLALIFTFVANKTPFGRHLYAIGGNVEAARLSGINIRQRTLLLFLIMGILTAVAGIVFTARLAAATTSAGQNFEF